MNAPKVSASRRSPRTELDVPAPEISTPAPNVRGGDLEGFIWQQLGEIRSCLGKVEQAITQQTAAIDKLENKHEQTHDKIHAINIKLAFATAVIAVVGVVAGWIFKEVWDVAKPVIVQKLTADVPPQANSIRAVKPTSAQ